MKTSLLLLLIIFSFLLSFSSAEECGRQAGGALCPNNLCCSPFGWCGDTEPYSSALLMVILLLFLLLLHLSS
ncbi:BnaA01g30540D [Brassica napus]|uniref:BnaA01g30540D protein n=1 Tax=Brassica napus TaxID=3708 RepID=A0A078IKL3_BRANA|nr:unnamed protein product [Brassica napus]CDY50526.1 BnaA01g30540D [Brassica napus]